MPKVNKPMNPQVAQLMAAGASAGDAVRICLATEQTLEAQRRAIPDFAARWGMNPKATASAIYGNRSAPPELLNALCTEQGGSPDEWREVLVRQFAASQSPVAALA